MDELKNDLLEEVQEADTSKSDLSDDYTWYDDGYKDVISGTVSDKTALSIYKPKVKKIKNRGYIFSAVISSVITAVICCSLFALFMWSMNLQNNESSKNDNETTEGGVSTSQTSGKIAMISPTADEKALSVPEIYSKVSPAVVSVLCTKGSGYSKSASSGSGVILTEDGYIVTNNHVIEEADTIVVKTIAGQSFEAELIGADQRSDLAVLKVSSKQKLPVAELGDSTVLKVGDLAVAIGNPLQEELVSTLTVGYISAIDRTMVLDGRQMTMLQTDAAINPGNSGGALIDTYGRVIGITTAKTTGYDIEGIGFAIPMGEAVPVIEAIMENGYVAGRPLVGITAADITEEISKANNLPVGVYVDSVINGGAADLGGIKKGDVIIKFDGQEVKSVDKINAIRDTHSVGDKIEVVVVRNGAEVTCTIELQEDKPAAETGKSQNSDDSQNTPPDFFSFFGW